MTFVVETGAGLADANAYVSVEGLQAYCADRGVDVDAYTDAQIEQAIVKATQYIDATYTFRGLLRIETQALSWPRGDLYDRNSRLLRYDTVPNVVKDATCELAVYALSKPLTSVVTSGDRVNRVKAGSAEVEFAASTADIGARFTFVDRMLSGLTVSGTGAMSRQTVRGF